MIRFYPDASKPVTLPLACDPSMREANSDDALSAYLESSDPSSLTVPPDTTQVVLRPLTHAELAEVRRNAGPAPMFGIRIQSRLDEAEDSSSVSLTAEEQQALIEYQAWAYRLRTLMLIASLERLTGAAWDDVPKDELVDAIDQIRPVSLRSNFLVELSVHIQNLTSMSPEGKA